ncbi:MULTISPECIES: DegV family protein [unclassified Luteibacter]|uniref:DegV family protein n=1 Tax=unclassified Luteibacter TaxID=2620188 RepID=UPI0008D4B380|nr:MULTISPECIES: DegV family protein [unclassified Luteibacter]MDR6937995.1 DegV family protein with EDD domain [Luteibacter sp. 3190]SEP00162.1 EDD domain protein, DegV family [Luteibacter sp. UNC138MFCol5.1]SEW20656.1 EDD domain protein, DegV family [Luteibacter sp. 329MFSha]
MRIGVAIDAACDVPHEFIEKHGIAVMPITVKVDQQRFKDDRDPAEIQRFRDQKLGSRSHSAETEASSVEDVQNLFLGRMVKEYDCVICLTIMATRSPIHDNVIKASFAILKNYRPVREAAGIGGPFLMRVVDTRNIFAGAASAVVETVRMIQEGRSPAEVRERAAHIADCSYGYMLPRDLNYLRSRARSKGDRSVSFLSSMLGTALDIKPILRGHRGETGPVGKVRGFEHGAQVLFDYVTKRVQAGLLVPSLSLSYGGDLDEMRNLPGYTSMVRTCGESGVEILESPMGITGMVNVGEGAMTIGFASEDHVADF